MMLLNENFCKKMKDMRVRVNAWIYPLSCKDHHIYITSQQVKICLSILLHHLPQYIHIGHAHLNDTEATALYMPFDV